MSTREYAKNLFSAWSDDDFCRQPVFDKLLFQVLNGSRTVNTAGVFPLNFTRMRKAMRDGDTEPTDDQLRQALARMEVRGFVYTDEEIGEGLIRSRIRRDELEKQPTVLLSALRILIAFDSPKFAAVMAGELDRIELPTITSSTDKANALRNNLKRAWDDAKARMRTLSEGYRQPFQLDPLETLSRPSGDPLDDLGKHETAETLSRPSGDPPVSVSGSVSVSTSSHVGGYVGGARATDDHPSPPPDDDDPEPPEFCPKHRPHGDPEANCGPCGGFRRLHDRWAKRQPQRHAAHQAAARALRENCTRCHGTSTYEDHHGHVHKCDHTSEPDDA